MLLKIPNKREGLIREARTGVDPVVDFYLGNPEDPDFVQATELRKSQPHRMYLEACLLASDDYIHIGNVLELPEGLIQCYAKIYYDVAGWDRLAKMSLVGLSASEEEQSLKMWALSQGLEFIAWRLGQRVDISAVDGLTGLFGDCVFKSKEALFNENASEASKESAKWVKLTIEIGKLLKVWVTDSKAASKDIELALQKVMPNYRSIDEVNSANRGEMQLSLLGEPAETVSSPSVPSIDDLLGGAVDLPEETTEEVKSE